jgi:hypothetical protein
MAIETGYFFITDITGYTGFLTHSELDHAKEILDALFENILGNIEPPLIVSNTQGDAIICYAPADAFYQPQQLLGVMEKTYFDFRHLLDLMKINNTCDCDACLNMSLLDLKLFLHHGQYLVQRRDPGPSADEKLGTEGVSDARLRPDHGGGSGGYGARPDDRRPRGACRAV